MREIEMDFTLPDGLSARAHSKYIGFGKINFIVAVKPALSLLLGRVMNVMFHTVNAWRKLGLRVKKSLVTVSLITD